MSLQTSMHHVKCLQKVLNYIFYYISFRFSCGIIKTDEVRKEEGGGGGYIYWVSFFKIKPQGPKNWVELQAMKNTKFHYIN
jgi:hypothetical protein